MARARAGSVEAWNTLFERFDPLVRAIARRHRLPAADADDVSQTVWLRLTENLVGIKDPKALPGWITTTTFRECLRETRRARRVVPIDPVAADDFREGVEDRPSVGSTVVEDDVVRDEARRAVYAGLGVLSSKQRLLILLAVAADPPVPYHRISEILGMPVGSIGPTRARCLRKLRDAEAIQAVSDVRPARSTHAA